MHLIARNHNALAKELYLLLGIQGVTQNSRNGPVLRICQPVTMTVASPRERVNTWPTRDANPFFHLMEALAMLASCNDATFLAHFARNMLMYSDDGARYNAFYGERLRRRWGDQLDKVIGELTRNPESRQAVAQIWDPMDLELFTKDKACNLCLIFDRTMDPQGRLTMTSVNRSNDAIWGIGTGANVVHLSFFHEYVACALGIEVGAWHHFSHNVHVYKDNPQWAAMWLAANESPQDVYTIANVGPLLFTPGTRSAFDEHLRIFVNGAADCAREGESLYYHPVMLEQMRVECPFVATVAVPVFNAWQHRKLGHSPDQVSTTLDTIAAPDWRLACHSWVARRTKP
jgi:thymidylate synthase